jgi:hypothetical protein
VRPIVVYGSNLDLPLTDGLRAGFDGLRAQAMARGAFAPLLWAASTRADGVFDEHVDLAQALDPDLGGRLAALAVRHLPLRSQRPELSGALFSAAELAPLRELKVCFADPRIQVIDAPTGARAFAADPQRPPRFQATFEELLALPADALQPASIHVGFETCADNCDRYAGQVPGEDAWIWDETAACLLQTGVSP